MAAAELLGIDLGTSSVKVGLFDHQGALVRFARHPYAARPAGEVDPEDWWAATAAALREAGDGLDLGTLRAVCCGGQGPSLVLVDADVRPVRPTLPWWDSRATRQSQRLADQVGTDRAAFSLVPRLLWVAEHEPRALEASRWALQAWDFIAARLAGGQQTAASTSAGDVVWREDWLAAAGLAGSQQIPPAVEAGTAYATSGGRWAEQAGVPAGVPIVGGMNDGLGSILGADGSVVGRATDPGGAAGGLAVCWDQRLSLAGVDCWPGLTPATFILGGAFVAGGRALDWWTAASQQPSLQGTLELAARAPAGAGGLVCLPFLDGERSPVWDPTARGALLGLTFAHGPEHLARAVVEATAYELRLLVDAILGAGVRIDELRVCGGQARNRLWNQVKADVTGLPTAVPQLPEVALMGDAICAARGAGLYPDLAQAAAAMVRIGARLEPTAAHRTVYDELFGVYRAAYAALQPLFGPLGRAATLSRSGAPPAAAATTSADRP